MISHKACADYAIEYNVRIIGTIFVNLFSEKLKLWMCTVDNTVKVVLTVLCEGKSG